MKAKWMAAVVAVAILALVGQSVWAQPPARGQGPQGTPPAGARRGMGGAPGQRFGGMNLSAEQQEQMSAIRQEFMGKIREAETPEARQKLFQEMREAVNKILTEEQRAQMQQRFGQRPGEQTPPERPGQGPAFNMEMFQRMSEQLNLSPEQRQQVAQMVRDAMQRLMRDIRTRVLTEEQRAKLDEMQPPAERPQRDAEGQRPRQFGGMFGMEELGLSEEQQKKMEDIRNKYMGQMQNADREQRREIFEKMRQETDAVLTPEQRQKMEELRQQRFQRFGGGARPEGAPERGARGPRGGGQ